LPERIFLTFDVEEVRDAEGQLIEESLDYSANGCNALLDLLADLEIPATFFITGFFASRNKNLVRRIKRAGHEIASHGHRHIRLTTLGREELKVELEKAVHALEEITKVKPIGFRAPYLAINNSVLDLLEELGFKYDSSLDKSIAQLFNRDYSLRFSGRKLYEFQISHFPLLRLPISWHWLRNLGTAYTSYGIKLNLKLAKSAVLFFHSWAFSDAQCKKGLPKRASRKTGNKFALQLKRLLSRFKREYFYRLCDFLEAEQCQQFQ
jgi:peptidoglycan/xylan/chitin deacetylase (PgdA/CDA1 family)